MHVELKQKERGEKEIRRSVFLYLSLQSTGRTENFLDTQRSGKNEKDKFEISKKRRSHFLTILYFFIIYTETKIIIIFSDRKLYLNCFSAEN